MAVLKVLQVPDPRLKLKALPVDKVDAGVARLLDDMLETMYISDGAGLAAPQVGVSQRVIVLDIGRDRPEPLKLVNPELLWVSDTTDLMAEACLSVPEQYAKVERALEIKVRYRDAHNKIIEREAQGLLAHVIQHEIDHLDGILFVDRLSPLKRNLLMAKALKSKKVLKL